MPELRLNVVTNEWVIISSKRADRPHDYPRTESLSLVPAYSEACPFCPGNEHESASETYREPEIDKGNWFTRVVLNKYPALNQESGPPAVNRRGPRISVDGYGHHEVIIETPVHNQSIALRSRGEVATMLHTYRARYRHHARDEHIAQIIIFKNHGKGAGTSLIHPHSQLVALPVVPPQVQQRIHILNEYLEGEGGCLICETIKQELDDAVRILHHGEHFIAVIPYAALSAYHTWIIPKRHMPAFGDITDDELNDLADTLRSVLRMIHFGLGNPDFNFLVRSAPLRERDFHWYLAIVPRIAKAAGFELGSGMYINSQRPRQSVEVLRSTRSDESTETEDK